MTLTHRCFDLPLAHRWMISSGLATGGKDSYPVVFAELTDARGRRGLGESAPSHRYGEDVASVQALLARVDAARLDFDDVAGSLAYLDALAPGLPAAKTCLDLALLDGQCGARGIAVYDHFGLGFREGRHVTSFSIGLAEPAEIERKVAAAAEFPILKLKVGSPRDRENFAALRRAAPDKTVRVDANEAWTTKEQALREIEWLAADGHVEFIEQPMPADAPAADAAWLKARSPLPLFADESYHLAADAERCAAGFHGVNVKLVKTGGLTRAHEALRAARQLGLKTMIGCMIESSLLITAAAHLAALADHLDIDGNLLITDDPYRGVTSTRGLISFASATRAHGLRVTPRAGS